MRSQPQSQQRTSSSRALISNLAFWFVSVHIGSDRFVPDLPSKQSEERWCLLGKWRLCAWRDFWIFQRAPCLIAGTVWQTGFWFKLFRLTILIGHIFMATGQLCAANQRKGLFFWNAFLHHPVVKCNVVVLLRQWSSGSPNIFCCLIRGLQKAIATPRRTTCLLCVFFHAFVNLSLFLQSCLRHVPRFLPTSVKHASKSK